MLARKSDQGRGWSVRQSDALESDKADIWACTNSRKDGKPFWSKIAGVISANKLGEGVQERQRDWTAPREGSR